MATPSGSPPPPLRPDGVVLESATVGNPALAVAPAAPPVWTLERELYKPEGICSFDFFQSIRLLNLLGLKDRVLVGGAGPPPREIVRFLAHLSLSFPASSIQQFVKGPEAQPSQREPDAFSRSLFSLIGLGFRSHRDRFRVAFAETRRPDQATGGERAPREKELARLSDLALLRFGGLFAHRPRCATSMEMFLQVYLQLPVKVLQFQGHWLHLNSDSQTAMGASNNRLGQDTLVGDRVWDVQSKVRIRLGPLTYEQFLEFLPDRTPLSRRKRIFLLAHLVRFYLGAEMDVEFQLVLQKEEVPATQTGPHSRLGWNTWSRKKAYPRHADDTVFAVSDQVWVNDSGKGID